MQQLGRYELGAILGEGGSGRVHEAVLRGPGGFARDVALKVLHTGSEELRREARIGGLLRHPNLVDVFEIGEEGGRWFCAMERCEGSLGDHAPLPERALRDVALQVCRALQYAHEELGLVHLDLKPGNLLLADGRAKVADLGIARADGFEHDGRIRGTPSYMAPEQAAGFAVDPRTDIYALGITLYDLAMPPRATENETLDFDLLAPPVETADLDPGAAPPAEPSPHEVPAWLDAIVQRCIAPNPEARWQSMAELAAALEAVEVDGPDLREHTGWREEPTLTQADLGTNLGGEATPLIGRETELEALHEVLGHPCLLTLKGTAGIGKSRLARAAAWRHHATGAQAWFVDLVEVSDADGLVAAVAWTLGVPLHDPTLEERVARIGVVLANRGDTVVIFDNFEHVLDLAPLVARWREEAPELRILCTSREPLHLDEEQVVGVGPLDAEASVALLVERAFQRGAHVEGDPDLPELAARLDGIPLALELAAGRLGVLSVRDVLDRLGLSLLRAGTEGRHGTLQAALDWSWDLLGPVEQQALAQLSVFAGGFTLELAEAVLRLPSGTALDTVGTLVDRSLCRVEEDRFSLAVAVQEYAAARLEDAAPVRRRHAEALASFGSPQALAALERHGGTQLRRALGTELDNLIAAFRTSLADDLDRLVAPLLAGTWAVLLIRGPYDLAEELAAAALDRRERLGADLGRVLLIAARVAQLRSRLPESQALTVEALEAARAAGDAPVVLRCLRQLATMARLEGAPDARDRLEEVLGLYREAGDVVGEAQSLTGLGLLHTYRDPALAEDQLRQALALNRRIGNRRGEGLVWGNLAGVFQVRGDFAQAMECTQRAVDIARELGSRRSEGIWLGNLGVALRNLGRPAEAREHYLAALAAHRDVGNRHHAGSALGNLGRVAAAGGRPAEARPLLEEALVEVRAAGDRRAEAIWTGNLGMLAIQEGEAEAGRALVQQAVDLARDSGHGRIADQMRAALDDR